MGLPKAALLDKTLAELSDIDLVASVEFVVLRRRDSKRVKLNNLVFGAPREEHSMCIAGKH
eukprot:CAMPEP_0185163952 /NCGR_PEP_ID=MMETSP1139-20130426/8710_1 /TAXON_ID=298111 /ORGANISM="Pavlova sp., Strain CCMP459" /LENGTH=60 /DNA_ID=CAMNT_0027729317 /DNA_START=746 /DNA_END=925 /DNA_ORIENTATION=+